MSSKIKGRVSPPFMIIIMLCVGVVFVGYNISTTQVHNDDTTKINEQTLKLVQYATDQNNEAIEQNTNIEKILYQQGNISKEVREKILADIIRNNNETIPAIFAALDDNRGHVLSLTNKVNELFLAKSADAPSTNVFNSTNVTQ